MASQIETAAVRFRRALLEHDAAAQRQIITAYGQAWRRIETTLATLTAQIDAARQAGETVSASWLQRQAHWRALEAQILAEVMSIARMAGGAISTEQAAVVGLAQEHAEALVQASMGTPPPGVTLAFARLPTSAIAELVGVLQDGSPLTDLLLRLGPDAADSVRRALVTGLATGENPRQIARRSRAAFGGNQVRAMTVARTEVLRAYRESARQTFLANRDVVTALRWWSARDRRTCVLCWARHGSLHRLDEPISFHVRCRCVVLPVTKTWRDLGYDVPEPPTDTQSGAEAFADLPAAQQRAILGPAKYAAYRAGAFDLEDLIAVRRSRKWGRTDYEKSLSAIVGAKDARQFIAAARA